MHTKINGHSHILPKPEEIPTFMKTKKYFWVDLERSYMHQGEHWRRPITAPEFFLDEKLLWMDQHNIDHAAVMTLSQLYCNGVPEQDTFDIIRFQNDYHAKLQSQFPHKFTCGFVVQPRYIDQALLEIERCVETLNLSLLCLPTHFLDANEQWTSVADEQVFPIYELANQYNLALEIHPYDGPKFIHLQDRFWRFHLIWMIAQTADTFHLFSLLGLPLRYPNIRTCFAHGCMLGAVSLGRRMQGYHGRPDLFQDTCSPKDIFQSSNVFFDTVVHDPLVLDLIKQKIGVSQLVWGLDDPYPLGEVDSVIDSYPGKVLDDAIRLNLLTTQEQEQIWSSNVRRWLGRSFDDCNVGDAPNVKA